MTPSLLAAPALTGVTWGQSTRHGGVSRGPYGSFNLASHVGEAAEVTAKNWSRLETVLGFGRRDLATCNQAHGHRIIVTGVGGHLNEDVDAIVSLTHGVGVGVYTADCVPVLYAAPGRGVAAAHCG